jgi:predicted dehydrogenase
VRVAVLGCGSIGTRHAKNLVALGHEVIAHDVDLDRELAVVFNITGLLAAHWPENLIGVEAALICTPASTHAAVADELLQNGYQGPLFVEKPLALSVDECEIFRRWPHPTTMVGYNLRFHGHAAAQRAVVPAPDWIECRLACDVSTWPGRQYADFILEGSHELDLALWFGGEPVVEHADLRDPLHVTLRGRTWSVQLDGRSTRYQRQASATNRVVGYQYALHSPEEAQSSYASEISHFLDCVSRRRPTQTPFADGLRVLEVIAQAHRLSTRLDV